MANQINVNGSKQKKNKANDTLQEFMESLFYIDIPKQLSALKTIICDTPITNPTKIAFFQKELANGRYQIDSLQIVKKMTQFNEIIAEPEMA